MHFTGKDAVTSGKHSLAAKLAASPVWLSLTLDAETFPSTGQQVCVTCLCACGIGHTSADHPFCMKALLLDWIHCSTGKACRTCLNMLAAVSGTHIYANVAVLCRACMLALSH